MGEKVIQSQPENLILRTNIFGYSIPFKGSIAEWAISNLIKGESITGFTDIFFNTIYTHDLGDLIVHSIEGELCGVYHTASLNKVSKYSFVKYVCLSLGVDNDLVCHGHAVDMVVFPP